MRALVSKIMGSNFPIIDEYETEIEDYKDYYKHLECTCFDVVRVSWEGQDISIFVDDEGLLKPNYGRQVEGLIEPLFGSLVITGGVDEEGETLPIPEEFIASELYKYIREAEYQTRG